MPEVPEQPKKRIYNEFGVCIACQGGIEECLHNNLREENGKTICQHCGLEIKPNGI